jgi:hypothetical protein
MHLTPTENPETDTPGQVTLDLGNNKLHFKKDFRIGFWTINFDKGQIPDKLKGSFTSLEKAQRVVEAYLRDKERIVVEETADGERPARKSNRG